ncbi:MAG: class I SAM-dependent methyltransferase, partial [Geminicoccaceae bacterium]|nr:class I SAM-dependent methyltransferase [Geminicoccaceae bacterium]
MKSDSLSIERWRTPRLGSPWIGLMLKIAERLAAGDLTLELPDGSRRVYQGPADGPEGHLRLVRPRAVRRFVTGGSLGFAEAYLDGDWDSPDLPRALELLALNERIYEGERRQTSIERVVARLGHLLNANTRRGSRRNILAHYDLGNAFFERWLDPGMTYSAGRYGDQSAGLEEAQTRKFESLATMLHLGPGDHLLEIGCGWGSLAIHAARTRGCRVTGITGSAEQLEL